MKISSLSKLIDDVSNKIHKKEYPNRKFDTKYVKMEGNLLICDCKKCKKHCKLKFYKKIKDEFVNTFKFCTGGLNKFALLLRKGV